MDFLHKYFFDLPDSAFTVVEYCVVWVGFSVLVGLAASGLMLGKLKAPAIVTVIVGYLGTIVGWAVAKLYTNIAENIEDGRTAREELLTPATFCIAVAGALVMLIVYKLMEVKNKSAMRSGN